MNESAMTTTHAPTGTLRRFLVLVQCISCGDEDTLQVENLTDLPALPRPCRRCSGSQLAVEASVRFIADPSYHPNYFDLTDDDDAPRVGRPPKALLEHRRRTFAELCRGTAPATSPAYRLGASISVGRTR